MLVVRVVRIEPDIVYGGHEGNGVEGGGIIDEETNLNINNS